MRGGECCDTPPHKFHFVCKLSGCEGEVGDVRSISCGCGEEVTMFGAVAERPNLYFLASILRLVNVRVSERFNVPGCVVKGHIHCPRCVLAPLKYIMSGGWPSAIVVGQ
jgi:hypothetical protein